MHVDALKYFIIVADAKSISKAAMSAHISQSALSQMIQKLEEDFGHELLNRSNRGVNTTEAGEIVYKYAIQITKKYEKLLEELNHMDSMENKVYVSGISSLAAYSLPCMIYKLKKKYPGNSFQLEANTVEEIIRDIKDELLDIGFVDIRNDDDELIYHMMGLEKVVLIAKNDYPITDQISIKDLLKVELIMCTMNKKTCEHLQDSLKPLNKRLEDLNIIFNADSLTAVKSSVLNGFGMAFVPYDSIKHELYEKSIKLIEVEDINLDYDIYMVSKKPKELSKTVRESRDYLIEIGRKSFC